MLNLYKKNRPWFYRAFWQAQALSKASFVPISWSFVEAISWLVKPFIYALQILLWAVTAPAIIQSWASISFSFSKVSSNKLDFILTGMIELFSHGAQIWKSQMLCKLYVLGSWKWNLRPKNVWMMTRKSKCCDRMKSKPRFLFGTQNRKWTTQNLLQNILKKAIQRLRGLSYGSLMQHYYLISLIISIKYRCRFSVFGMTMLLMVKKFSYSIRELFTNKF